MAKKVKHYEIFIYYVNPDLSLCRTNEPDYLSNDTPECLVGEFLLITTLDHHEIMIHKDAIKRIKSVPVYDDEEEYKPPKGHAT